MRTILILISLTSIVLAGCNANSEELSHKPESKVDAQVRKLKASAEQPCLTNLAGGLAECSGAIKQKRFVLVRSVVIPE